MAPMGQAMARVSTPDPMLQVAVASIADRLRRPAV